MAKNHGPSIKDDPQYQALRRQGISKEKAARITNAGGRSETGKKGGEPVPTRIGPKKQVGVEGCSTISKEELIDADLESGHDVTVAMVTSTSVLIVSADASKRHAVARRIHDGVARARRPWGGCDADVLTPSALREASDAASGGTLFIDRVEHLNTRCQDALLHLLDGREPGIAALCRPRLLCGAAPWLWHLVTTGQFSDRLFYRLNTIRIDLEPGATHVSTP